MPTDKEIYEAILKAEQRKKLAEEIKKKQELIDQQKVIRK